MHHPAHAASLRANDACSGPRPCRHRALVLALLAASVLSACQRPATDTPAAAAAPQAAAPTPVAYTPPPADSLYQMVAPIALYPDRLVAQVLAASTYPDQIAAAETWLARNPGLRGDALAKAADAQPWDPSVKALTAFPNVLEQLAANLPWTTALGQAYFHDAPDVMNAIQVMRGRAAQAGTLRSSPRLRVVTASAPLAQPAPAPAAVAPPVPVYEGPPRVVPPPTVIAIEPAEPATVYVPRYDPQQVYGTPVAVYPGYRWVAPPPVVVAAQPGPSPWLVFGSGVVVGAVAAWGWNAWNVHWGPPRPPVWVNGPPPPPPPPSVRPVVVYQGATYVSRSRTVIENVHNHVTVNETTINNNYQAAAPATPGPLPAAPLAAPAAAHALSALAPARAAPAQPAFPTPPHALALATALSPVQHGPAAAQALAMHPSAPLTHGFAGGDPTKGPGDAAGARSDRPGVLTRAGAAPSAVEGGTGHRAPAVMATAASPAVPAGPGRVPQPLAPRSPEPQRSVQASPAEPGAQRWAAARDDAKHAADPARAEPARQPQAVAPQRDQERNQERNQERLREEAFRQRTAEAPRPPAAHAAPPSSPPPRQREMPPPQPQAPQHRPQERPQPQPHAPSHAAAAPEHRAPQGEHHRPHGG